MTDQSGTALFGSLRERYPGEWPSLRPDTWVWCLHCERCFRFIDAKVDPGDGLLMCGYWPDCDGSALDYWPWSQEDWGPRMESQERPEHWPAEPESGVRHPVYRS